MLRWNLVGLSEVRRMRDSTRVIQQEGPKRDRDINQSFWRGELVVLAGWRWPAFRGLPLATIGSWLAVGS